MYFYINVFTVAKQTTDFALDFDLTLTEEFRGIEHFFLVESQAPY